MRNEEVLISGAGIAGLALAFWLRSFGSRPVVVERAPAPRDGGQAVDLRGAAMEVVRWMGIEDLVRAARTGTRGMSYVNATGDRVADVDGAFGVIDPHDVEIVRGDLVNILFGKNQEGVEFIFDDTISDLTQDADGVLVNFETSPPRRFDLVVGADGLHSRVRSLAFEPDLELIRHLGMYLCVFSIPNDFDLDCWQLIYVAPGKSVTVTSARENREARAIFFFASEPLTYHHRDRVQQQKLLVSAFAGDGWLVPQLLEAMRHVPDFYFDSVSQVHMGNWSSGRIGLVGDAGYCASPLSGQGSSLAMVGAYVLAYELANAEGDHNGAFAAYGRRMRDFVASNQKIAEGNAARFAPTSRRQIWFQKQGVRLLPYMPGKRWILEQATKGVKEASTNIDLPSPLVR